MQAIHSDLLPTTLEAGMKYMIGRQTFYTFTKHTWMENLGILCDITNDHTGMYDITGINESVK